MGVSRGRQAIELAIDDLVLEGFTAAEGAGIRAALAAELERLLAGGLPAGLEASAHAGWGRPALDGGRITVAAGAPPAAVGAALARNLYHQLGRAAATTPANRPAATAAAATATAGATTPAATAGATTPAAAAGAPGRQR
jgi:hypothetical protein